MLLARLPALVLLAAVAAGLSSTEGTTVSPSTTDVSKMDGSWTRTTDSGTNSSAESSESRITVEPVSTENQMESGPRNPSTASYHTPGHSQASNSTHSTGSAHTPITHTSDELMTHTSDEPMPQLSDEPITHTSVEPITHTSDEPMTHTSDELMTHTSDEPMTHTSDEPMTHTSDEPMTHTSDEPVTHTSVEPMTHTSVEPMTHTPGSPVTPTNTPSAAPPPGGDNSWTTAAVSPPGTGDATSPPSSSTTPQTPDLPSTIGTEVPPTAGPPTPTPASSALPPSTETPPTAPPSTPSAVTSGVTDLSAAPPGDNTTEPTIGTSTPHTGIVVTTREPTSEPPVATAGPPSVCPAVPCPSQSVCLNSTCQCLSGSVLLDGRCQPAQVFPGRLRLTSLTFQDEMFNRSSGTFQNTSAAISAELRKVLQGQPGYVRSDVVQLQPGSVIATVNNVFRETVVTEDKVDQVIQAAIGTSGTTGLLANASFTAVELCQSLPPPCDASTTACSAAAGRASCSCLAGFVSSLYSTSSCRACPSGQRAVDDSCQPCPFGSSGFNCNDSSLLAVVVLACVLGGVLLLLVPVLLVFCYRGRCCRSPAGHISSPYLSEQDQPWPTGVTPIPRANSNWSSMPSIELTEGGSTNTLVDRKPQSNGLSASYDLSAEGMKTFKGKNTSRYSYLVQGHENPYFLPGDDKKD